MHRLQPDRISNEENETTVNIDHCEGCFSVYTTASRVARMLERQFKDYFTLAADNASAVVTDVPVALICRLHLSSLK
jgi:hypothetical protein